MNSSWLLDSFPEGVLFHNFSSPLEFSSGVGSDLENISASNLEEISGLKSNLDELLEHVFPLYLRIWVSIATGIIFLVGVCGNVMVPILIWKNKQLRHSTNIFLLNLAVADLLVLIICLPTALVELHTAPNTWILGSVLCQLVPFVEICVSRASVLTLTVISVERYIAICKPLKSSAFCTRPRALGVCLAIWPISLLASGPVLAATEYEEIIHANGHQEEACMTSLHKSWIAGYYLGSVGMFFLLPLVFLSTVYFLISRRLLSQRARLRKKTDNSHWKARKQVAAMLRAVVVLFFFCLLPFQIFSTWIILSPPEDINSLGPHIYFNILFACRVLIYANSAVNPIIYNVMSAKFRAAFLKLLGLPSILTRGGLRRQSTLTSSSFLSSSSFRRRASVLLQRSFSDASFIRGRSQKPRSSSFASVLDQPGSFRSKYLHTKERAASLRLGRDLKSRTLRVGAYFSSGSHSNCSSITDVNLPLTPLSTPKSLRYTNHLLKEPSGFFFNRNNSLPSIPLPSPGPLKRVSFKNDALGRNAKHPPSPLISKDQMYAIRNHQIGSGNTQPKNSRRGRLAKKYNTTSSGSENSEENDQPTMVSASLNRSIKKTIVFRRVPQNDNDHECVGISADQESEMEDQETGKEFPDARNEEPKEDKSNGKEEFQYFTKLKLLTFPCIHLILL